MNGGQCKYILKTLYEEEFKLFITYINFLLTRLSQLSSTAEGYFLKI